MQLDTAIEGRKREIDNVAKDINTEFRRIDKFSIRVNPLQKVVVTDNWIVMVGQWPWKFHLAHQAWALGPGVERYVA